MDGLMHKMLMEQMFGLDDGLDLPEIPVSAVTEFVQKAQTAALTKGNGVDIVDAGWHEPVGRLEKHEQPATAVRSTVTVDEDGLRILQKFDAADNVVDYRILPREIG